MTWYLEIKNSLITQDSELTSELKRLIKADSTTNEKDLNVLFGLESERNNSDWNEEEMLKQAIMDKFS